MRNQVFRKKPGFFPRIFENIPITAIEAQRTTLGDAVVDAALSSMREKLAKLKAQVTPTKQQRKQVTVLFAGVSGFTAMSETMDAEQVSDVVNALWRRIDAAITARGGMIDKHIGDAVMALWGVDAAREDDPERAMRAALAMQAELAAFREERDIQLAMRIGINTGPALLGEVRPGEFTATGNTVNLASRMEHAAPVGGILIAHDAYRHARGIFDVQPQEPLKVKGKTELVRTHIVQRAKPHTFRVTTRGIEGIETRMVGRNAELLALQNVLFDVTKNVETCVVTIVGEAGVGKSRLLHEFDAWAKLLPNSITRLKGRTTPEMQNSPYSIVRDMLSFALTSARVIAPPSLWRNSAPERRTRSNRRRPISSDISSALTFPPLFDRRPDWGQASPPRSWGGGGTRGGLGAGQPGAGGRHIAAGGADSPRAARPSRGRS